MKITQELGLKILWITVDGSNIGLVNEIAEQYGTNAMSCFLHLAGTIRNALLRNPLAIPVHTLTLFDDEAMKTLTVECKDNHLNSIRLEVKSIGDPASVLISADGTTLLVMTYKQSGISFETAILPDGVEIAASFEEKNSTFSFIYLNTSQPLTKVTLSIVGDVTGSYKLATVHEFSMDVLKYKVNL